ncbi:helicase HerA-like domain-containing protein [Millisia brevis]|uniref:helicase HerA-like domain-containing protein n=1 Tax=Millisia brevis TaxID=264148 RepID=UPI000A015505|nr:helicase HerA-like domain-containing protein [Millisia brevis]
MSADSSATDPQPAAPADPIAAARRAAEEAAKAAQAAADEVARLEAQAAADAAAKTPAREVAAPADPAPEATPVPEATSAPAAAPAPEAAPASAGSAAADAIAAGYAAGGPAVELGTVVVGDETFPNARVRIPLATMNRHGLVAGATGTGKTRTLQAIAEQLSANGVPVVLADIKGDLSGLSRAAEDNPKLRERAAKTGAADWSPSAFPTAFWSLGSEGIATPVRATITAFGPILLSKVLSLNATQESTLGLIFHWADGQGLPLLDLKDLRSVIAYLTSDEGKADLKGIGGVSSQTAGVILRALVNLEADGGDTFFGEPEFDTADLMRIDADGRGVISLFEFAQLSTRQTMFSTFLMWVLADLFQNLPEVGDVDKPKVVFIFDEAHLLFSDASKAFLAQVEQTVKLIRSKGVGVFFCTQLPTDVPKEVLSQLGARVQHALRAFTPDDQKALRATVRTYPKTDTYDLEQDLTALGTGEAIVTVLSERGAPTPVAWTKIRPPQSLMDTIGNDAITAAAGASPLHGRYAQTIDRNSAYEMLTARLAPPPAPVSVPDDLPPPPPIQDDSMVDKMMQNPAVKSFLRSAASAAGREIGRSIFGTGRRRRR